MRKFVKGPLKDTKLEIMPSKAATKLPNGTPIRIFVGPKRLNSAQLLHADGDLDVHQPQMYTITEKKVATTYVGPSIAQEWKLLYQGKRPFYQVHSVTKEDTSL